MNPWCQQSTAASPVSAANVCVWHSNRGREPAPETVSMPSAPNAIPATRPCALPPIPSPEQAPSPVQYHEIGTPRVNPQDVAMGPEQAGNASQEGSHSSYKSFDLFGPVSPNEGYSAPIVPGQCTTVQPRASAADSSIALQPRVSPADSSIALQPRVSPADSGIALQPRVQLGVDPGSSQGYPIPGMNANIPKALSPSFGNQAQVVGVLPHSTPQVGVGACTPQTYQHLLQAYQNQLLLGAVQCQPMPPPNPQGASRAMSCRSASTSATRATSTIPKVKVVA